MATAIRAVATVVSIAGIAFLVNRLGHRLIDRYLKLREKSEEPLTEELVASRKRAYTAAALLRHTLTYALLAAAVYFIFIALTALYPGFAGILAGVGVAGVALAFGAQAILRDSLAGFFIIIENQYAVGDVVRIRLTGFEVFGIVEELSLRFTKVRDLNGHVRFVPNGGILAVDRYAAGFATYRLDFLLPTEAEGTARQVISAISDLYVGHPLLVGPIDLVTVAKSDAGILVVAVVKTVPGVEWFVEKVGEAIGNELVTSLSLLAPPLVSYYEINKESLDLYERSVFVG